MTTGMFRINTGLSRSVIVTGDAHSGRMSMAVKALSRVGVLAVTAAVCEELPCGVSRPDITVEVTADGFIVDGSRRCVTIAEMLESILGQNNLSMSENRETTVICNILCRLLIM